MNHFYKKIQKRRPKTATACRSFTVETQPIDFAFVGVFSAKMKAQR